MDNLTGQNIKGYELQERIGTGGFGAVYRAHQSTVGREVAIKIILPHFANHPDFIRRFETEAQLVARLEHLHIIPLYDYWRDPNGAYLVMRWLRGGSLQDVLQRGALSLEVTVGIIEQITTALVVAHKNNIIHRDLKPANLLASWERHVKLTDFGIGQRFIFLVAAVQEQYPLVLGILIKNLLHQYPNGFIFFRHFNFSDRSGSPLPGGFLFNNCFQRCQPGGADMSGLFGLSEQPLHLLFAEAPFIAILLVQPGDECRMGMGLQHLL